MKLDVLVLEFENPFSKEERTWRPKKGGREERRQMSLKVNLRFPSFLLLLLFQRPRFNFKNDHSRPFTLLLYQTSLRWSSHHLVTYESHRCEVRYIVPSRRAQHEADLPSSLLFSPLKRSPSSPRYSRSLPLSRLGHLLHHRNPPTGRRRRV